MKKLTLLALAFGFTVAAVAKDKAEMPEKKNAVKLNLTSLAYKNIGIQYERAFHPKLSVAGQIRFMPKGSLPFTNSLDAAAGDSLDLSSIKVGSFAFTPELRFYPKHVMRGFYLAPYLRIRNISMDAPGGISYTDANNMSKKVDLSGSMFSIGGGLMIGSHFNIGKSFSLDWFILGLHFTSSNLKLNSSGLTLSAADQAKIESEALSTLSDQNFIKNYTVDATNTGVNLAGKFGMVGFRGFGLNFGYRF